MFIVFLRFSENKTEAPRLMADHKAWIAKGFEDGKFLLAGSIQPNAGGTILAHNVSRDEIEAIINEDPFVAENVVRAEIMEISPARTDGRLDFLVA